jgi:hypothetical protein
MPILSGATSDTENCPSNKLILPTQDMREPHIPLIPDETNPKTNPSMEVDASGDFFGDYSGYSMDDLGMDIDGVEDDDRAAKDVEEDIDDEVYEAGLAEQENGLEPKRTNQELDTNNSPAEGKEDPIDSTPALRLRGGFEEPLKSKPYIVKFAGRAGAVYSENDQDDNHRYLGAIGIQSNLNPYAPFASKMDWEIARWAKLRGPGSTAFTELMSIEGVS